MKKTVSFMIALALTALVGCGATAPASTPAPVSATASASAPASVSATASVSQSAVSSDGKMLKIGVLQLESHAALDATYSGFVDALAEAGYVDKENITIDFQNAQGELANCPTIASKLVNDKNDLILAIATPAAQAVANATSDIPVLVTAVTDPVDAKLVQSVEAPGGNVTGTSDLNPVEAQMDLLKKLVPDAKKIGFLYNSSETNSTLQIKMAKEAADKLGFEYEDFTVSSTNELQSVVTAMLGKVDAAYLPTDNLIAKAMPVVSELANAAGIPLIVGEKGMVDNGGLASLSISYYELGRITGMQAVEILKDGADPATIPVQYHEGVELVFNEETAKILDIVIPEE